MLMAPDVLDLMEAMRCAYDHAVQVLQPANEWECDRLASKIVELVQAGEFDAQRLYHAVLSDMREIAVPETARGSSAHNPTAVYTALAPNRFKDFWRE
jgi:hypothetical protein